MYSEKCSCCGGTLHDLSDDKDEIWEDIYSQIAHQLLDDSGVAINTDLYFKTAGDLIAAISKGLGRSSFSYDDDRNRLAAALKQNLYAFSSAKSFVQMIQYRDMMVGADGKILNADQFKKVIADQGELFNEAHLKAEHQQALQSAIMADKWQNLDTEYLEYSTVNDGRVRPEHQALDKFTAAKDDPVWHRIYPPLAWNCRCTVIPGKEQNNEKKMTSIEASSMIKPFTKDTIFDNNVGLSKLIFDDNHPYFQEAKGKIQNLSWEQYGLPSLDKIRANEEFLPTTKEEYLSWWDKQKKIKGDDIAIKDALNDEILLSSGEGKKSINDYYKQHVIKKSSENRFEYATETANVLKSPDEIWNNQQGRVYLKYYENGTLKLIVNDKLEAETIFKLYDKDSGELKKARKGTLLYKK